MSLVSVPFQAFVFSREYSWRRSARFFSLCIPVALWLHHADLPKRAVGGHFSDSSLKRFSCHRMYSLTNTYIYYWVSCRFCFKPFNVILFGTKRNGKIFIVDCFIISSLGCFSCHRFPLLLLCQSFDRCISCRGILVNLGFESQNLSFFNLNRWVLSIYV